MAHTLIYRAKENGKAEEAEKSENKFSKLIKMDDGDDGYKNYYTMYCSSQQSKQKKIAINAFVWERVCVHHWCCVDARAQWAAYVCGGHLDHNSSW